MEIHPRANLGLAYSCSQKVCISPGVPAEQQLRVSATPHTKIYIVLAVIDSLLPR
jgi:hypothetical protein